MAVGSFGFEKIFVEGEHLCFEHCSRGAMSLETRFGEDALQLDWRSWRSRVLRLRVPCVSRGACSAQDDISLGTAGKMPALLSSPAYAIFCILHDDSGSGERGADGVRLFEVARFSRGFHFGQLLIDLFVGELRGAGDL